MASLMRKLTAFARSPRGQQLINKAVERSKATAARPQHQQRIERLRRSFNQPAAAADWSRGAAWGFTG